MEHKPSGVLAIRLARVEAITVVGMGCTTSKADHKKNDTIGKFTLSFLAQRAGEIRSTVSRKLFGVSIYPQGFTGFEEYEWFCSYEVRGTDEIPEGMAARTFPEHEYADVTHKGSLRALYDTYGYFHSKWRTLAGYNYADRYDIQLYDARYRGPHAPNSELDIYFPVKRSLCRMPAPEATSQPS
ncbi:GyrI-like domain-containing protein [Paenibacillus cymbidii]|uniref:GyrI-like domain-containing protein n=1 Tax=Paenibacillus cymbidii TaxID=1639034 RepID=UPI001080BD48|nr:GyrI-like domain-containing protein [Paenibacillus cymbidii]